MTTPAQRTAAPLGRRKRRMRGRRAEERRGTRKPREITAGRRSSLSEQRMWTRRKRKVQRSRR